MILAAMPTQQPHVKSQHRATRWYQKMKANDMTIICQYDISYVNQYDLPSVLDACQASLYADDTVI